MPAFHRIAMPARHIRHKLQRFCHDDCDTESILSLEVHAVPHRMKVL
jgi:hypothetical protein